MKEQTHRMRYHEGLSDEEIQSYENKHDITPPKIMKENNKANNLQCGRIYINATTAEPCRLVNILPCQGVWLEAYDGEGYGETVKFDDVRYADKDDVQDFLEDLRAYTDETLAKA